MSKKDEKIKAETSGDIRKTVKNNNKKKATTNDKKVLKKFIIILLVVIILIAVIVIIKNRRINIKDEPITEYNYFLFSENGKNGIIDKTGNIIINPEYDYVQIPNPEKPIFICMYNYDASTQEYSSKVLNDKSEEIFTQYNSVRSISNNNTSKEYIYQNNILKYKSNGKYGIITMSGKKVTSAIYDSIETLDYKDKILKVSKDGKYGIIKFNGEQILKNEYDFISSDGYYNENTKYEFAGYIIGIKENDGYKYGYINYKGKEILECKYSSIKRITEIKDDSYAYIISYEGGKAGLNKNSQLKIKNEYEAIEYDDVNKIVSVQKNGKYGVYDLDGNMVLPVQYDELEFAGKIITAKKNNNQMVFDANGNIQKDSEYTSINITKSSNYFITIKTNGKYGIADSNNDVLVDNKYDYLEYAFDNYFIFSKSGKSGVIDSTGKEILKNDYNVVQHINGTNIIQAINSNTNVSSIFDKNISKILEIKEAHIYIKDNYIKIISSDNIDYLDFDGNKKDASEVLTNNNIFAKKQNGKWGYVNRSGNTIVNFVYDFATDINEYGYGAIKQNGKWGVINSVGEFISDPVYQLDDIEPTFIGEYYKINEEYEISIYSKNIKQ